MLDLSTQARYRELATWIARRKAGDPCPIIGINGAQGSGKSTAAAFLRDDLASAHGLLSVVLSLDDFYLSRAARQTLAAEVHPLFTTRGVPGTHDVALGIDTLKKLRSFQPRETMSSPRFSKAVDDRLPMSDWSSVKGPVDLILFEGWCVGTPPQQSSELDIPANELETADDADGRWRRTVNNHLATSYAEWFSLLDALVFLRVPDFDCVRRWRWQQEQDTARSAGGSGAGLQSRGQLDRFIQHYERLTAHALRVMPERAEVVLMLGEDHTIKKVQFPQP